MNRTHIEQLCIQAYMTELRKLEEEKLSNIKKKKEKEYTSIQLCREDLKILTGDDLFQYLESTGEWSVSYTYDSISSIKLICKINNAQLTLQYKDNSWIFINPYTSDDHYLECVKNIRDFILTKIGAILCQN